MANDNELLRSLKFVQGAVARKDFVQSMTHFRIENGFVRAFNGTLALCSPIPVDTDCIPKADALISAIDKCSGALSLSLTSNGKLHIVSGGFDVYIDCVEGETPHVDPAGDAVMFDGEVLMHAIRTLMPFVGDDAARPWTNGILLRDQSAFATNNVCLVEYWLGTPVPFVVNIPRVALKEMLRIGDAPLYAQVEQGSLTLHYEGDRWLRTQLLETAWPDLRKVLDLPNNPQPINPMLFEGLDKLSEFTDNSGRIYIQNDYLATAPELEAQHGARFHVEGLGVRGLYQVKMLSLLKGVATHADFSRFPDPVLFFGERLRGAILGMRV